MCVIAFIIIDNNIILFKNRDRLYKTRIKLVHTIINDIEIAYLHDIDTNWIEGINEYGISLVNSSLQVKIDEIADFNDIVAVKKIKTENSGKKILQALSTKKLKDCVLSVLNYKAGTNSALMGHTIISNKKIGAHIEVTIDKMPIIKKLKFFNIVLSNHGIYSKSGYISGRKKVSSVLRKKIIEKELDKNNVTDYNDIFNIFNKNYTALDPRFCPYRNRKASELVLNKSYNEKTKIFSTTCQIMFNPNKLEFNLNIDKDNCILMNIINNLPKDYTPKIKINILYTNKSLINYKLPISQQYINHIMDKYNYKN
jgi:hypothetical protein